MGKVKQCSTLGPCTWTSTLFWLAAGPLYLLLEIATCVLLYLPGADDLLTVATLAGSA